MAERILGAADMRNALCLVLLCGVGAFASSLTDDAGILLQLRQDIYAAWPTGLPRGTTDLDTWNRSDSDPCSWTRVGCTNTTSTSLRVTSLDLSRMQLQGPLPARVGDLTNLSELNLGWNNFSGSLPAGIFNATALAFLNIQDNAIQGLFPQDIRRLPDLYSLNLAGNRLSGTLAPVAGTNIIYLSLSRNKLTGGLDPLQSLTAMQYIFLDDNQLNGSIPPWIAGFTSLRMLYLGGNNFSGDIPADLGSRGRLEVLSLPHNKLTGQIPEQICANGNVTELDLAGNMLVGSPPQSFFFCSKLRWLRLEGNQLNGSIQDGAFGRANLRGPINIEFINMSSNRLSGSVPSSIGTDLIQLDTLDLSHNSFTGAIPAELLNLPTLQNLDLSWNSLSGQFPAGSFRAMAMLSVLNLSRNNLSGPVPDDLAYLARNATLSWLDLSHNAFTGRVPELPTMNQSLFADNPGLCSDNATLQLQTCAPVSSAPPPIALQQSRTRTWVAAVSGSLAAVVVVASAFLFLYWRRYSKKGLQNPDLIAAMQDGDNAIVMPFKTLHKATHGFSESAQIGRGGFGTVYKGVLPDGTVVAIKRSRHQEAAEKRQFLNEVRILMQLKHRNLVRLLGCCLERDIALLVLEYVPGGTLADHIQGQALSWRQRLKISVQTADAVCYLHSSANTPIYHRDMKPANILLDQNLNAKVADFGISRLASLDVTHVTTDAIQGTPGYIDPEYYQTYQLTGKSDVYSFGVVLLQILTAKAAIDHSRGPDDSNLVKMAAHLLKTDGFDLILDKSLMDAYNRGGEDKESILGVAHLAIRCVQLNPRDRPTMREVLLELAAISRKLCPENLDELSIQHSLSRSSLSTNDSGTPLYEMSSSSTRTQVFTWFR